MERKADSGIMLTLLLIGVLMINVSKVEALVATQVSVEPSSQTVGEEGVLLPTSPFTISITVQNVEDLYAWQIVLYYNSTILNTREDLIIIPTENNIFKGKEYYHVGPFIEADSKGTYIIFGAYLMGVQPGATGSGVLCQINFTGQAPGTSELNLGITTDLGVYTCLLNSNVEEIPISIVDDQVTVIGIEMRRPTASFTYSPLDPYVGETVTFDASASYDPDGTIVDYLWDFGDSFLGHGVVTTHNYATSGTYTVTLTVIDNDGLKSTLTTEVKVLRTTINVEVKVGSIHFRGEIAEFYVLVSSLGKPVDASIKATLYFKGEPYEDLSASVEHVSLGLYRIPYTIPLTAPTGTYALVVETSYLSLSGISLESFLLSPTLTGWNALLVSINGTVGTVKTDLGLIKVKLDAIDAKLIRIEGMTATINSTVGLIQTDLDIINTKISTINGTLVTIKTDIGTISGKITAIEGDIATIQTDIGTIKTTLQGWAGGTTSSITTPQGTFKIFALTTSTLVGSIEFSDNVITLTVSGEPGTTGTTHIVIPKQLLSGIESTMDKVVVAIDDKQIAYTYTEQLEAYVLSIAYTHSTHTIKIYLAGLPPTPPPWTLYIIIATIIVLAVIASLAIYVLKIRKPQISKPSSFLPTHPMNKL